MNNKELKTALDYEEGQKEAAHRVLVELANLFKNYENDILLIGGWVPEFMYSNEGHVGSVDVDLLLNHLKLREESYLGMGKILLRNGYQRHLDKYFTFVKTISIDGVEYDVDVDFLAGMYGGSDNEKRSQHIQGVRALKATGGNFAFEFSPQKVTVEAKRPDGALDVATINVVAVVAFSNGKGGKIIFGVEDGTRNIIGVDVPNDEVFKEIDAITNAINDACFPKIFPNIYPQTIDGKTIIIAEISSGNEKPYYLISEGITGGVYVRSLGTTRKADRLLTEQLYYDSGNRSYDMVARQDLNISDDEIGKLCAGMKGVALAKCRSEEEKQSIKDLNKNILLSWGILDQGENGKIHPTNAYLLLTGETIPPTKIRCAVFEGRERIKFLDMKDYGGPLWAQAEEAYQFVMRNMRVGSHIEGLSRANDYEFPPESIRELIINAIMNCSYVLKNSIQVALYSDRLEIITPGGLVPGVTIEKMKEGYTQIRNKALSKAFLYMKYIEGWGTGVPKVIKETREFGLSDPIFVDNRESLKAIIYRREASSEIPAEANNLENIKTERTTDNLSLTKQQKLIYELIQRNGETTSAEVAVLLGVKERRARVILKKMISMGFLQSVGLTHNIKYVLK